MAAYTAVWLLAAWAAFKVLQAVYNVFFHPLRHFPGPRLAKVSRWWLYREEMRGDSHLVIQNLHEVHGKSKQPANPPYTLFGTGDWIGST